MSGDLVSLRMVLVGAAADAEALWRDAAGRASVPIDFESGTASAAKVAISRGGVDFCVADAALDGADTKSLCKAARAKKPAPLVFASAARGAALPDTVDGVLPVPGNAAEARKFVEICIRAKMPTPVLVASDSDSLRGVVRKILGACRFQLDVHEAADSADTLESLRKTGIGLVFLDSNMPGLNGADILQGIKRARRGTAVVVMSPAPGRGAAASPHLSEALALLKKPFYPADVDAVLKRHFGLAEPK
ncbi:MAG TPA: response regulator [Pseudolabrys sp.]|nr:response regulator [Pseudolabrys sp.]